MIGCLLGPRGLAVEQQGTKGESQTIHYTHAVPLLHHWTGLSAALEMGLELVSVIIRGFKWPVTTAIHECGPHGR